jgi:hypothetical protein
MVCVNVVKVTVKVTRGESDCRCKVVKVGDANVTIWPKYLRKFILERFGGIEGTLPMMTVFGVPLPGGGHPITK